MLIYLALNCRQDRAAESMQWSGVIARDALLLGCADKSDPCFAICDEAIAMIAEYTVEQLKAALELRGLRQAVSSRTLSRPEKRSLERFGKVLGGNMAMPTATLPSGVTYSSTIADPMENVSSETIFGEICSRQKVIYGDDDRVEVVACDEPERRQKAGSVAAIIERSELVAVDGERVSIGGSTLEDRYAARGKPICQRESFRSQPCSAIGTAFLVTPNIVATAHHCLNEATIDQRCLLFDYEVDAAGTAPVTFGAEQLYGIRRFLAGIYTDDGEDWALVELEREVEGREPLRLRANGTAADNTPLYVIGHPSGLPKKIAGNAEIRANTAPSHFVANLDTYGGNSGSPVFNALTNEVEGILVRGDTDFVPLGNCYASLICPITGCRGEDCSRITPIAKFLAAQSS